VGFGVAATLNHLTGAFSSKALKILEPPPGDPKPKGWTKRIINYTLAQFNSSLPTKPV
jgi:hypothetical protein